MVFLFRPGWTVKDNAMKLGSPGSLGMMGISEAKCQHLTIREARLEWQLVCLDPEGSVWIPNISRCSRGK